MERISNMDLILIKWLYEVISFKEIPIKVSFNEYIEISKYYSTQNSKVFINGILDKIVSQFKREGKFQKLVETYLIHEKHINHIDFNILYKLSQSEKESLIH